MKKEDKLWKEKSFANYLANKNVNQQETLLQPNSKENNDSSNNKPPHYRRQSTKSNIYMKVPESQAITEMQIKTIPLTWQNGSYKTIEKKSQQQIPTSPTLKTKITGASNNTCIGDFLTRILKGHKRAIVAAV